MLVVLMKIRPTKAMNRNALAVVARMRPPVVMKHRSEPRGGSRDEQAELLDEWLDWD